MDLLRIDESLGKALAMITGPPFVQLDAAVFRLCRPLKLQSAQKKTQQMGFHTWRPVDTHVFTLIKIKEDTVAYCHDNDTAYFANPCAKLGNGFPVGVAVLAHWCIDRLSDGSDSPHLLVFDIIDQGCCEIEARGERLRVLSPALPQPLGVVQWAGEMQALQQFAPSLPHAVEGLIALTDDPLVVVRHVEETENARHPQALREILEELSKCIT